MKITTVKTDVVVWALLLLLLALTLGSAYVPLGAGNLVINLAIAIGKATLVAIFFMHLRTERIVNRLAVGVAILMLMILLGLTLTDYLTRG